MQLLGFGAVSNLLFIYLPLRLKVFISVTLFNVTSKYLPVYQKVLLGQSAGVKLKQKVWL